MLTAQLAREALGTELVKLEVIGDEKTLFPDNEGLLEAAKDSSPEASPCCRTASMTPSSAASWKTLGCAAVMPLAAPIGSGLGIRNPYNLRIIVEQPKCRSLSTPGWAPPRTPPSPWNWASTALLMHTAIAQARNPVKMATAMRLAVEAGPPGLRGRPHPEKALRHRQQPADRLDRYREVGAPFTSNPYYFPGGGIWQIELCALIRALPTTQSYNRVEINEGRKGVLTPESLLVKYFMVMKQRKKTFFFAVSSP